MLKYTLTIRLSPAQDEAIQRTSAAAETKALQNHAGVIHETVSQGLGSITAKLNLAGYITTVEETEV